MAGEVGRVDVDGVETFRRSARDLVELRASRMALAVSPTQRATAVAAAARYHDARLPSKGISSLTMDAISALPNHQEHMVLRPETDYH